jgi:hypothetical protein
MPASIRSLRLSTDLWAVVLSLGLALLIKLGVLKSIGW